MYINLTPFIPLSTLGEGEEIKKRGANAPLKPSYFPFTCFNTINCYTAFGGGIAQLGEQLVDTRQVAGSSPVPSTGQLRHGGIDKMTIKW